MGSISLRLKPKFLEVIPKKTRVLLAVENIQQLRTAFSQKTRFLPCQTLCHFILETMASTRQRTWLKCLISQSLDFISSSGSSTSDLCGSRKAAGTELFASQEASIESPLCPPHVLLSINNTW